MPLIARKNAHARSAAKDSTTRTGTTIAPVVTIMLRPTRPTKPTKPPPASRLDANPKTKESIMLPKISSYGEYSSDNYGAHSRRVELANITLFYSYDTIVAYRDAEDGLIVSENQWSTTTGKHLNWIDGGDKKSRKPAFVFSEMLAAACKRHNI